MGVGVQRTHHSGWTGWVFHGGWIGGGFAVCGMDAPWSLQADGPDAAKKRRTDGEWECEWKDFIQMRIYVIARV